MTRRFGTYWKRSGWWGSLRLLVAGTAGAGFATALPVMRPEYWPAFLGAVLGGGVGALLRPVLVSHPEGTHTALRLGFWLILGCLALGRETILASGPWEAFVLLGFFWCYLTVHFLYRSDEELVFEDDDD